MAVWKYLLKATTLVLMLAVMTAGITNTALAKSQEITVATIATYPPFEWRDPETGNLKGYDIDILNAVTKKAGLDYKFTVLKFNGIIPALLAGQVDMAITGMSITKQRAKKVDFSEPYYNSGIRILVRSDNHDIHSINDLKGHKVGTETGTTSYFFLKDHVPNVELKLYPASSPMYMSLLSGNVDADVFDEPGIEYFIKTKGKDRVKTVGPLYEGQYFGMAFPKGSPLRKKINAALTKLKENGTFSKIYAKWFGKEPPKKLLKATE
jgi:glutamine transport system substrate-binding protein